MAEQKPSSLLSRPVIISILAALGIAGAVAAPTVFECSSADGGFGLCVRQKLQSVGILPAPATDSTGQGNGTEVVAGLPEAAPETATPSSADRPAPDASPLINARVEPDGSAVLVGTAAPNTEIQFFANGQPIGTTKTDAAGDWVFIPEQPLPGGGVALTTDIAQKMNLPSGSADSLAIVVDPAKATEPQVVVGSTDQIGQVLVDLTGANPIAIAPAEGSAGDETEMEVAAVTPQADVAAEEQPSDLAVTTPITEPQQPQESVAPATEETPQAETAPEADATASEQPAEPAPVTGEPAAPTPATNVEPTTPESAEAAPETATPQTAVPTIPLTIIAPTIDAVEIDGPSNFIAGAGTDGSTVKLFVDDVLVGQTVVDGGRWLVEAQNALTSSNQRIRAEFIGPDGQSIEATPEVNFVIAGLEPQTADAASTEPPTPESTGLTLSPDSLAPAILPTEAPPVPEVEAVADAASAQPQSPEIVLPADQLAPLALPVEAPAIVSPETVAEAGMASSEEAPAAAENAESGSQPAAEPAANDSTSPAEAPAEPTAAADAATTPTDASAVAESGESASESEAPAPADLAQPETEVTIPADQLAPATLPTEAPQVPAPDVTAVTSNGSATATTAAEPAPEAAPAETATQAPSDEGTPAEPATSATPSAEEQPAPASDAASTAAPDAAAESGDAATSEAPAPADLAQPEGDVTISADQLAPATLPTEAPPVPAPDAAPAPEPAGAQPDESAAIPANQLAPAVLPTEAPPVPAPDQPAATEPVAESAPQPAEAAEVTIPADQLAPAVLPTTAPPVPAPAPVRDATAAVPGLSQPEGAEIPTLTVVAVGEPGENRFASGKVIIRRGDNLWTISRRVYGFGRDYVRIFEANRDKINDPHWIYPGQVFDLPAGEQQ